jgi:hypothetical protein
MMGGTEELSQRVKHKAYRPDKRREAATPRLDCQIHNSENILGYMFSHQYPADLTSASLRQCIDEPPLHVRREKKMH